MNGPRNSDRELVRSGYARFSGEAPYPYHIAKRIDQMLKKTDSSLDDIKELFFTTGSELQRNLLLPLSPDDVWEKLIESG